MVSIGDVTTWDTGCDLEHQSKKVMEEAAEVWWSVARLEGRERTIEECCDVIQATCNLLSALGVTDMTEAMAACERRNRERGRYGDR